MMEKHHVGEGLCLLRRESDAFIATLSELEPADWDRPTSCPPWTVRQLAAHVIRQVDSYIGSIEQGLRGEFGEPESREARTQRMNEIAAQEPARILADWRDTVDRFEAWFGGLSDEQLLVQGPHSHGPRSASWFVEMRLAEVAFHCLDLQRSLGRPDDLDRETARFLLPMLVELNMPSVVRRDRTGGEGRYALEMHGEAGAAWLLTFSPGALTVTRDVTTAEASFEADPAALALLVYGRARWPDLERDGRLAVRGSREAAARFHDLFRGP